MNIANLLVAVAVVTTVSAAVYYFNLFVDMEQDVNTARAQIDRELQRRADLVSSLLPAVFEYAELERDIFTEVARVRTQLADMVGDEALASRLEEAARAHNPDVTPDGERPTVPGESAAEAGANGGEPKLARGGDSISDILGRLVAVSEQYPDMKSSTPFKMLMDKVTEIEDRLAVEREKYNDCVNRYTTLTTSFPGKVFARVFGFDDQPLFAADAGARATPEITWPPEIRQEAP